MVFVPQPGVLSYFHTQNIASSNWTIQHNFGKTALAVDCMIYVNGNLETAIPYNIEYPDANTVIIQWASPKIGNARLA